MAWGGGLRLLDYDFAIATGFRMRTALMFVLLVTLTSACGFKGPLTLPDRNTQQQATR